MADLDVFAAMGISGFGKSTKKKQLDPARFDKNKRDEVGALSPNAPVKALTVDIPRARLRS